MQMPLFILSGDVFWSIFRVFRGYNEFPQPQTHRAASWHNFVNSYTINSRPILIQPITLFPRAKDMVIQKKRRAEGVLLIYFSLSILFDGLARIVSAKYFPELPIGGVRLATNAFVLLIVLGAYKFVQHRQQAATNTE